MGRKTFESLPKMLPNRKHIVISSNTNFPEEVEVFKSIEEFLEKYKNFDGEIYVIGGGKIYSSLIGYTTGMYLTIIDEVSIADTFFPEFDENEWNKKEISYDKENGVSYKRVYHKRKF